MKPFINNYNQFLFWTICSIAIFRLFIFNAAFPFFNNIDEQAQFDTVVKYSRGNLPHKNAINYEYESAKLIVLYGSPEYLTNHIPRTPLWRIDSKLTSSHIKRSVSGWIQDKNHEAFSPPIYYSIAGIWYNLGKSFGLAGGFLLYWIRFLNVFIYAIFMGLVYRFFQKVYQDENLSFGILLLLAFFPQKIFYAINSDVLSPVFCLVSLYLLFQIYYEDKSVLFHFFSGLAVAATFLVKFSNCPILIISAVLIFSRAKKLIETNRLKSQLPNFLFLLAGCSLPIILWLCWNVIALGDITGNAEKVRLLGWEMKPLDEILNHPIFSTKVFTLFLSPLLKNFWRGNFSWGMQPLTSTLMDSFYVISSFVFILFSVINSMLSRDSYSPNIRFINLMSALTLFLFVSFLAILSILYDFHQCYYPSREYPFFVSGRLILGALVPFLILYMDGLRIIVSKLNRHVNPLIFVLLICIAIIYSEIHMTIPVFRSCCNWFHMFQ